MGTAMKQGRLKFSRTPSTEQKRNTPLLVQPIVAKQKHDFPTIGRRETK